MGDLKRRFNPPTAMSGADLEAVSGHAGRLDIAGPEVEGDPGLWKDRPFERDPSYEYLIDSEYPRGEDDARTIVSAGVSVTAERLPEGVIRPIPGATEAIDPAVSQAQNRAMHAAAEGRSTLGIPKSVGQDFVDATHGHKVSSLPARVRRKK